MLQGRLNIGFVAITVAMGENGVEGACRNRVTTAGNFNEPGMARKEPPTDPTCRDVEYVDRFATQTPTVGDAERRDVGNRHHGFSRRLQQMGALALQPVGVYLRTRK